MGERRAREKNERQGGREIEGRREEGKVEEGRGVGEVREEGERWRERKEMNGEVGERDERAGKGEG